MLKRVLLLSFIVAAPFAHSNTGWRTIEKFGCHNADHTCYAYISGDPVGPEECNATSIRWNSEHDPNGKVTLTLLTSAFFAGKRVNFNLKSTCYEWQTGAPTIQFIEIEK